MKDTRQPEYTERLHRRSSAWWKQFLNVQAPYRWNIRRLRLGFVLDVGCGVGRNLRHLNGHGVGVDHNPHSVAAACAKGLRVFTPEDFAVSEFYRMRMFDTLLLAHVVEHMRQAEALTLLREYLPLLKPSGRVILICPQEAGYRSDPTHVEFMDFSKLRSLACAAGLTPVQEYSFPFPRLVGQLFRHNEFILINQWTAAC